MVADPVDNQLIADARRKPFDAVLQFLDNDIYIVGTVFGQHRTAVRRLPPKDIAFDVAAIASIVDTAPEILLRLVRASGPTADKEVAPHTSLLQNLR